MQRKAAKSCEWQEGGEGCRFAPETSFLLYTRALLFFSWDVSSKGNVGKGCPATSELPEGGQTSPLASLQSPPPPFLPRMGRFGALTLEIGNASPLYPSPAAAGKKAKGAVPASRSEEGREAWAEKEVQVALQGSELWKRFHDIGTEMIITKAGR